MYDHDYLEQVRRVDVYRRGDRRAPHKPLLLLLAICRLLQGQRELDFQSIDDALLPLLNAYAPPVQSRHQPELPYWHLRSDGLWEILGADQLERQASGFPRMGPLRQTRGRLTAGFADALLNERGLLDHVIATLLTTHFPESLHEDILDAVGLSRALGQHELAIPARRRDPEFRQQVLMAYEHQCAVSGFRAAFAGSYFACEAAHVQWHAFEGPDSIENGIALEPTIHKLFDAGAWTLTDDRRILVSAHFTGSYVAVDRLRSHHGKPLRSPLPGQSPVSVDFIRWHREPQQGGVFRFPALQL